MRKRWLCLILCAVLCLSGCAAVTETGESTGTTGTTAPTISERDMFTDRDLNSDYDAVQATYVTLTGTSATCKSGAVQIRGSTVTVTDEGTYVFTGTLTDGRIVVEADDSDKPHLIFHNVSVTSATSAALYIVEADKVVVTLAAGSQNTLANGGTFTAVDDNNIDGAVFSKQDLTFNGSGSLTVTSPAAHGIVCKDDLVFTGGTYTVTSASHGLDVNDSIRLKDSTFTVNAGKDGFHAEHDDDDALGFVYVASGAYTVTAEGDGLSGSSYVHIQDGTFDIVAGGGSVNAEKHTSDHWGDFGGGFGGGMRPGHRGMAATTATSEDSTSIKGIKAGSTLTVSGGTLTVDAADDALHANGLVTVSGGTLALKTGDDGIHADDTLTVTGGTITVSECYEGLEAQHVRISGGDIRLICDDDGLNAAGGADSSGTGGHRPGGDRFGGMGGGSSSNGSITVSGGTIYIQASGDGIDANGTLTISGGHTTVVGPTQGDTSTLDFDISGTITGGTFVGTGAAGMAQSFSDAKQAVIALRVGNFSAGTVITVADASGKTLLTHVPELPFAIFIYSSPALQKGESYTLSIGSQTERVTAN